MYILKYNISVYFILQQNSENVIIVKRFGKLRFLLRRIVQLS